MCGALLFRSLDFVSDAQVYYAQAEALASGRRVLTGFALGTSIYLVPFLKPGISRPSSGWR